MPDKKSRIELLFIRIHEDDKAAFDELFREYYTKLLLLAKTYIKQLESAEEITSEIFVTLWIKRDGLHKVRNPEVYLYIAVKNACLNLIRFNKKRQFICSHQLDEEPLKQIPGKSGHELEDKELSRILDLAIEALPERRRMIFQLVKEQNLKSSVVAQIMGLSVRTVENQLYKAIKTLAETATDYLGYHPQTFTQRNRVRSLIFFL